MTVPACSRSRGVSLASRDLRVSSAMPRRAAATVLRSPMERVCATRALQVPTASSATRGPATEMVSCRQMVPACATPVFREAPATRAPQTATITRPAPSARRVRPVAAVVPATALALAPATLVLLVQTATRVRQTITISRAAHSVTRRRRAPEAVPALRREPVSAFQTMSVPTAINARRGHTDPRVRTVMAVPQTRATAMAPVQQAGSVRVGVRAIRDSADSTVSARPSIQSKVPDLRPVALR